MCSALRSKSRIQFEGVSVIVPQVAKHPCICRHRWNPNPNQGPLVKRMAMHLGQFMVISLAENVTALSRSVLPIWQRGHCNPWYQKHHHSWWGQCSPCHWHHHHSWWCFPLQSDLWKAETFERMGLCSCTICTIWMLGAAIATPITVKPYCSIPRQRQPRPARESHVAKNPWSSSMVDLRARRSFEHNGCR